jgi:hypothetical protein
MTRCIDWSRLPPPAPALRCVVVLPVRDEAALLPGALAALADQAVGAECGYEVLVLANNCRDDSAARAHAFAASCEACAVHVVEADLPAGLDNVGVARHELMEQAARRLAHCAAGRGVILGTDADSRVDPEWIAATLQAIDAGADAVGGWVRVDASESWSPGLRRLLRMDLAHQWLRTRLESLVDPDPCDPWPRHHQYCGASFALTAQAYRRIGALLPLQALDDGTLADSLRRSDLVVRHSHAVRAVTSGRLNGKCPAGLSRQLRHWARCASANRMPVVEDPRQDAATWALRRKARRLWRNALCLRACRGTSEALVGKVAELAGDLEICPHWTATQFATDQTFGRLWDKIERLRREHCGPGRMVLLDEALVTLRHEIHEFLDCRPTTHQQAESAREAGTANAASVLAMAAKGGCAHGTDLGSGGR